MYSEENIPKSDLRVPNGLRKPLKEKVGDLVDGKLPERYTKYDCIITVGDVVTDVLIEQDIVPDLALVDGKTRRGEYESKGSVHEKTINIKNPAGIITRDAWEAIQYGLNHEEPITIIVDGEEDLLSLVVIALANKGCLVIYGIPDEGMVINIVDNGIKAKSWEVINKMVNVNED
ncbi:MAG: DUF359 domain-containing protein [Candidatus Saliniplasma sp.]